MNDSQLNQARLMKLITYDPNVLDTKTLEVSRGLPDFNNMGEEVNLATYYRYGTVLSGPRLTGLLKKGRWEEMVQTLSDETDPVAAQKEALGKLSEMDCTEQAVREAWMEIGRRVAREQYHFDQFVPFLPESKPDTRAHARVRPPKRSIDKTKADEENEE